MLTSLVEELLNLSTAVTETIRTITIGAEFLALALGYCILFANIGWLLRANCFEYGVILINNY